MNINTHSLSQGKYRKEGDNMNWTPCDEPIIEYDENGKERKIYKCPYADTYSGSEDEMCRVCCGLGVDE